MSRPLRLTINRGLMGRGKLVGIEPFA